VEYRPGLGDIVWGLVRRVRRIRTRFSEFKSVRFLALLVKEIGEDDVSNTAAGVAYYAFLSLFPLLLGLIALLGLFLPSEIVQRQVLNFLSQVVPGSVNVLESNIQDVIRLRGALGLVGLLGLFWSGTGVFSAITHAVNRAWDVAKEHPFYIKKPREFAMILAMGFLFLLSLSLSTLVTRLASLGFPQAGLFLRSGTVALAFVFSLLVFLIVYKFIPHTRVNWQDVWLGALLSAFLFEAAKFFFIYYLNTFGNYDRIYGSIGSIIVVLVWIYYSAFILIVGAEFCAIFRRTRFGGVE
jgi:membrane protein